MPQLSDSDLDWLCNEHIGSAVDFLLAATWRPAVAAKLALASVFTRDPLDFFWHPLLEKVAVRGGSEREFGLKAAAVAFGANRVQADVQREEVFGDGCGVKIAASNT